jgi:hypothetical protein
MSVLAEWELLSYISLVSSLIIFNYYEFGRSPYFLLYHQSLFLFQMISTLSSELEDRLYYYHFNVIQSLEFILSYIWSNPHFMWKNIFSSNFFISLKIILAQKMYFHFESQNSQNLIWWVILFDCHFISFIH